MPDHRGLQRLGKLVLWSVAKLTLSPRTINRISIVMSKAVCHKLDLRHVRRSVASWCNLVEYLANLTCQRKVGAFVSATECIAASGGAALQRLHHPADVIFYVDPITDI